MRNLGDKCRNCGCERQYHVAKCNAPVFSNTACVGALDVDDPCWCFKFVEPERKERIDDVQG